MPKPNHPPSVICSPSGQSFKNKLICEGPFCANWFFRRVYKCLGYFLMPSLFVNGLFDQNKTLLYTFVCSIIRLSSVINQLFYCLCLYVSRVDFRRNYPVTRKLLFLLYSTDKGANRAVNHGLIFIELLTSTVIKAVRTVNTIETFVFRRRRHYSD